MGWHLKLWKRSFLGHTNAKSRDRLPPVDRRCSDPRTNKGINEEDYGVDSGRAPEGRIGDRQEHLTIQDIRGTGSAFRSHLISYSLYDFKQLTEGISGKSYLGDIQFAKLYRGMIAHDPNDMDGQEVTVKIWVDSHPRFFACAYRSELESKLNIRQRMRSIFENEIKFLQHPSVSNHPNLAKIIGFCETEELLGVVYELKPLGTLHDLIMRDNFSWLRRIKVALGLARLLEFLHSCESPYLVNNITAAHILIDQDFNPRLLGLDRLSGGIMGDAWSYPDSVCSRGYIDPHLTMTGAFSVGVDIYAYGIVLLGLISKRVIRPIEPHLQLADICIYTWAMREYDPSPLAKCSLVHVSLQEEPVYDARDGPEITRLAMECLRFSQNNRNPGCVPRRPSAKEIVRSLQDLYIARSHVGELGV